MKQWKISLTDLTIIIFIKIKKNMSKNYFNLYKSLFNKALFLYIPKNVFKNFPFIQMTSKNKYSLTLYLCFLTKIPFLNPRFLCRPENYFLTNLYRLEKNPRLIYGFENYISFRQFM